MSSSDHWGPALLPSKSAPRTPPQAPHHGAASASEIEARLRRRYLTRLRERARTLRRLLVARLWEDLREECRQIASGAFTFDLPILADLSQCTAKAIPTGRVLRADTPPWVRENAEVLIAAIEAISLE